MYNPHVAVLVLGYNHKDTLKETLNSALVQTYPNYEITYIDNNSQDGSVTYVKENYPNIHLIENKQNLGYAGAYKQALKKVFQENYDAAVLLNPDVVADHNWLAELTVSAYASDSIAFAQPKIYLWDNGPTDVFNTSGNEINFLGFGYCGRYKQKDEPLLTEDAEITYASGASLFIKKEIYQKLPGLDETFFAYLEDQDLNWQARLQDYKHIVSARSIVWHKYDFQKKHLNNFKFYLLERNRLTFLLKYYSWKLLVLILPIFIIMEAGVLLDAILKGYLVEKLKSYRDFFKNISHTLKDRGTIQANRKVSDKKLFRYLSPTITFEEVGSPLLTIANILLKGYYSFITMIL